MTFKIIMFCRCQVNECEPQVMWLSGLHIPESYLTALVQATCRKNGWPLDKSTLYTSVTQYQAAEDVTERTHHGQWQSQTGAIALIFSVLVRIDEDVFL